VTLALAEPLTAWLLATFLVGEQNSAAKIVGAALLLLGLVIVSATGAPRQAPEARHSA
jgi:DME family drug/metabolite transporter